MVRKILVIRFSSIGDIVLTSPVVRVLKNQLGAEVHFLTKSSFFSIVKDNPHIDKVLVLEDSLQTLRKNIRCEDYDYVLDLHNNLRSRMVTLGMGLRLFRLNKLNFQKWIMVNFKLNILPKKHIVERYLETGKTLGLMDDGGGLDFYFSRKENREIPFVAVVLGAAHFTKRFPPEKIVGICRLIKSHIILLGGKEEWEVGQWIQNLLPEGKAQNMCGRLSLQESADMVNASKVVVTNDTGMMHIASALGKKMVTIWGNTVPEFGMYPWLRKGEGEFKVFEIKDLSCRPCSKIGFDQCPKGHFQCMQLIDEGEVAKAVNQMLE
jgi:ADP-heptose:LPS heptosyltransferase